MTLTNAPVEKVVEAYFILLGILSADRNSLLSGGAESEKTAKAMRLFVEIEPEYARRGYRPLLPSCGLLPGARPAADGTIALAVMREPGEEPVFYGRAVRRNIERKIIERGSWSGTGNRLLD